MGIVSMILEIITFLLFSVVPLISYLYNLIFKQKKALNISRHVKLTDQNKEEDDDVYFKNIETEFEKYRMVF